MKTSTFPIYDKRDGAAHHDLAFKTLGEVLGLPWNGWLSRGCSGFDSRESGSHERELRRLIRVAQRKGERILGASLSNYGVEIAVESYCGARPSKGVTASA